MKLLEELLIIFAISVFVLIICNRLKISSIIGLLITGILAGPSALGFVSSVHDVEILSEIGIILLLFTIGLEFSIKDLLQIKRAFLIGGALQVFGTCALVFCISYLLGFSPEKSVLFGFIISLSSTAIILKVFQEKSVFDSLHGKTALGLLLFQDVIVVPMMLTIAFIGGNQDYDTKTILLFILKSAGIIIFVAAGYKWIVPWMFYQVTKTRSRELFILSVVVFCFAVAWLTYSAGLSLALGAFIAGLLVSKTEYSHEALGNIIPFKEVFMSIFFISVGMLIDINTLIGMPLEIISLAGLVVIVKFALIMVVVIILGYPLRTSMLAGLSLCQIGEFSFILVRTGSGYDLMGQSENQVFLACIILTMLATPFIINNYEKLADLFLKIPFPEKLRNGLFINSIDIVAGADTGINNHVIIIGFGVNGRNVSHAARGAKIPYVIIEMNPDTVKEEMQNGESIFFGDGSKENVLKQANIEKARILVLALPDAATIRRTIKKARTLNPDIYIIARTRYVQELETLYRLGADEVIPEEYETSVEIFSRVLNQYRVPQNDILKMISEIRSQGYRMFRSPSFTSLKVPNKLDVLKDMEVVTIRIEEGSPASGRTIGELAVRKKYGISIISIERGGDIINNPDGDTALLANDVVWLLGSNGDIFGSYELFRGNINGGGD